MPDEPVLLGEEHATALSRPYWDGLRRGELILQRCTDCGTWQHYPRRLCRSCWTTELEFASTGGRGRLLAAVLSHRTPKPALRERLPIHLGLVALAEGPVLLACLPPGATTGDVVVYDSEETLRAGLLSFRPDPDPATDR
jgi:uncharacterized OB-fold protein